MKSNKQLNELIAALRKSGAWAVTDELVLYTQEGPPIVITNTYREDPDRSSGMSAYEGMDAYDRGGLIGYAIFLLWRLVRP